MLRPSSPLSAKASTKCSCLLVHSIRIYYSHSIHTSNTIIPHTPFPVQANHGFFRISIKLFFCLPGANKRCFISAYVTFRQRKLFSSFLKTSKNHIFIQFFVRSYSLCLISLLPYSESKPCSPRYPFSLGGGKEVRTPDLRLAKPSLSQLSYTPDSASTQVDGGPGKTRTSDLTLIRRAL